MLVEEWFLILYNLFIIAKEKMLMARRRKPKSAMGCLLAFVLLPIDAIIKPLMAWDGFTTSATRKRRKRK